MNALEAGLLLSGHKKLHEGWRLQHATFRAAV